MNLHWYFTFNCMCNLDLFWQIRVPLNWVLSKVLHRRLRGPGYTGWQGGSDRRIGSHTPEIDEIEKK